MYPKLSSLHTDQEPISFIKGVIKLDTSTIASLIDKDFPNNSLGKIYFLACLNSDPAKFRTETLTDLLSKYYPNLDLDNLYDTKAKQILRFLKENY